MCEFGGMKELTGSLEACAGLALMDEMADWEFGGMCRVSY